MARLKREKALEKVPFVAVGDSREEHDVALAAGADGFVERRLDDSLGERGARVPRREARAAAGGGASARSSARSRARWRRGSRPRSPASGAPRAASRSSTGCAARSCTTSRTSSRRPLTPLAGYLRIVGVRKARRALAAAAAHRRVDARSRSRGSPRIVDNLADFASLEVGEAPLLHGEVEPDRLADDVVQELKAPVREARLHVQVMHGGGGAVLADPRKLRQALANLVSNAVKFSPHGGEVLVEVTREPRALRFTVYDQGPGIRPGEADRIFEPLYHAAARGEDARLPGSGLGLPVARRIAEAHGGRVYVESPPRTQPASARAPLHRLEVRPRDPGAARRSASRRRTERPPPRSAEVARREAPAD